jgi:hypothetical protein
MVRVNGCEDDDEYQTYRVKSPFPRLMDDMDEERYGMFWVSVVTDSFTCSTSALNTGIKPINLTSFQIFSRALMCFIRTP